MCRSMENIAFLHFLQISLERKFNEKFSSKLLSRPTQLRNFSTGMQGEKILNDFHFICGLFEHLRRETGWNIAPATQHKVKQSARSNETPSLSNQLIQKALKLSGFYIITKITSAPSLSPFKVFTGFVTLLTRKKGLSCKKNLLVCLLLVMSVQYRRVKLLEYVFQFSNSNYNFT